VTETAARPEPVRNAAAVAASITTAVGLVLTILVVTHVLTPDDSATLGPALATALPTLVGAVSAVVAALRARLKVTPLSAPRDADGQRLVAEIPGRGQTPGVPDHAAPE
jgi:protein-S-isoprenylcysteine O-methyltransferase Ste14